MAQGSNPQNTDTEEQRLERAVKALHWLVDPVRYTTGGIGAKKVLERAARIFCDDDRLHRKAPRDFLMAEFAGGVMHDIMEDGDPVAVHHPPAPRTVLESEYVALVCSVYIKHYDELLEATHKDMPWVKQYLEAGYPITDMLLADAFTWSQDVRNW